jgi:hypothetical protein
MVIPILAIVISGIVIMAVPFVVIPILEKMGK